MLSRLPPSPPPAAAAARRRRRAARRSTPWSSAAGLRHPYPRKAKPSAADRGAQRPGRRGTRRACSAASPSTSTSSSHGHAPARGGDGIASWTVRAARTASRRALGCAATAQRVPSAIESRVLAERGARRASAAGGGRRGRRALLPSDGTIDPTASSTATSARASRASPSARARRPSRRRRWRCGAAWSAAAVVRRTASAATRHVVNACGAWANKVGGMMGRSRPLRDEARVR